MAVFFGLGALVSAVACASLLFPGGPLEPMWRLNPRAREAFAGMGGWAPLLLLAVSAACALTAAGLWRGRRWGYRLAVGMLLVNLGGDVVNVLLGTEPRAVVGIPIVAALLALLARPRVRGSFS